MLSVLVVYVREEYCRYISENLKRRNKVKVQHCDDASSYLPETSCRPANIPFPIPFAQGSHSHRAVGIRNFYINVLSFPQFNAKYQTSILPDITDKTLNSISNTQVQPFHPNTAAMQLKFVVLSLLFAATSVVAGEVDGKSPSLRPLPTFPISES